MKLRKARLILDKHPIIGISIPPTLPSPRADVCVNGQMLSGEGKKIEEVRGFQPLTSSKIPLPAPP
jgi:hypothetical protein